MHAMILVYVHAANIGTYALVLYLWPEEDSVSIVPLDSVVSNNGHECIVQNGRRQHTGLLAAKGRLHVCQEQVEINEFQMFKKIINDYCNANRYICLSLNTYD